jgi:hypothetical protein
LWFQFVERHSGNPSAIEIRIQKERIEFGNEEIQFIEKLLLELTNLLENQWKP